MLSLPLFPKPCQCAKKSFNKMLKQIFTSPSGLRGFAETLSWQGFQPV